MHNLIRAVAVAAPVLLAVPAGSFAASTLAVSPGTTHPANTITVNGAGFAAAEAVDVYIDTTDTLLLVSSATGSIAGSVTLPASASPGAHYVTAVGRRAGDAAQAALTVSTPWVQMGYGVAKRSQNPYENSLGPSTVGALGPAWTNFPTANGGTPVVSGGSVYATGVGVTKLTAATGATKWTTLTTDVFYGGAALSGSTVFAGGTSGNLYALSTSTGATLWTAPLGSTIYSSPAYADGVVYVGSFAGVVYAVSATTGAVLWSYTTGGLIDGSAAVTGVVVYIGSNDKNVYALNAATGALLWQYATTGAIESTPAVSGGILYIGSDDQSVYAIRAVPSPVNPTNAGTRIWSTSTGGSVFGGLAVANGVVYASSVSGNFLALDGRTGGQLWSFATNSYPRGPAVANGVVYFTSNSGGLYALNAATGAKLLYGQSGSSYLGGPAISDGVLYVNAYHFGLTAYTPYGDANVMQPSAPKPRSLHPDHRLAVTR